MRSPARNLALFDFDGTLTTVDTFVPFIRRATPPVRFVAGFAALSPLILAYKAGFYPATKLRAQIVRAGLTGTSSERVAKVGARYAADTIPNVLRPDAMARLAWHKDRGDRIVVVSASLCAYLRAWCASEHLELISTELETNGDLLTGRYRGGDCTGAEKARRIRERINLSDYAEIYVYGDTPEDHAMLALASHPFYRGKATARSAGK